MATFIDLSAKQQTLELAGHICNLKEEDPETADFYKTVSRLLKDGRNKDALLALIGEDVVFAKSPANEIESFYGLLIFLLSTVKPEESSEVMRAIITSCTSATDENGLVRLSILVNLYNTLPSDDKRRYDAFVAIVQLATQAGLLDAVSQHFANIETLLKEWGVGISQQRTALKLVADAWKALGNSVPAHKLLVTYLYTFENADVDTLSGIKGDAARAVVEAVTIENMFQMDHLQELASIRQLESDAEHSKAFELLRIFSNEKLGAYTAFASKNGKYIKSVGLDPEGNLRKMRLLSLVSLASENEAIPYGLIAETLNVTEEQVEPWVIKTIKAELIEATMDQLEAVVHVRRVTQRKFTQAHWKKLGERMSQWKSAISDMLVTLENMKRDGGEALPQSS